MIRCLLATWAIAGCASAPAPEGPNLDNPGDPSRIYLYQVDPQAVAGVAADTVGTVEVTGYGEVTVDPDRVETSFAVETEAESARAATTKNAERMEAVIAALRDTELEGLRIETHGYNLQPRYRRANSNEPRANRIVGYQALNNVRVSVADISTAGPLIDAAIDAGANRVASLVFLATETEQARLEALRMAVENARREAEIIAQAMGVPLGPPLEVRGTPAPVPRLQARASLAMAAEALTPVEPTRQTVRATVTIRYRLGG